MTQNSRILTSRTARSTPAAIHEIANTGVLDDISNYSGAVLDYIPFYDAMGNYKTGNMQNAIKFAIYQTRQERSPERIPALPGTRGFYVVSATEQDTDVLTITVTVAAQKAPSWLQRTSIASHIASLLPQE